MTAPLTVPLSSHPCSACAVQSSFCPFSAPVRDAFEQVKATLHLGRNAFAFHEADDCRTVFIVCEGRMKLVTGSSEGRLLLLRFAEPGQLLGAAEAVLGGTPYECSAIAVEPTVLAAIPRDTFIRFISSYPEAACRVTVALSDQYKRAQREEKFLGFGETSVTRLAHLLLEWSAERGTKADDGVHIPLHVTHTDLAHAIGSTRETVTRILGDLSQRGILTRTSEEIVIFKTCELARLGTI